MQQPAIVIHSDFVSGIRQLSKEQAGELMLALCAWSEGTESSICDGAVKPFAAMLIAKQDEYQERYLAMCAARRKAGRKGGKQSGIARKKHAEPNEAIASLAQANEAQASQSKKTKTKTKTKTNIPDGITVGERPFDVWFDEVFWKAYPRKDDRKGAMRVAKRFFDEIGGERIMAALERAKGGADHRFRDKTYTPYAKSWLNGDPAPWSAECEGMRAEDGGRRSEGGDGEKNAKKGAAFDIGMELGL